MKAVKSNYVKDFAELALQNTNLILLHISPMPCEFSFPSVLDQPTL